MAVQPSSWFLTAPEISFPRRRGDPLGMQNITNEAAEMLAPGLTNRTRDARWITLLAWSLVQSDRAWRKTRGAGAEAADHPAERYLWLRPLELLWVSRSIKLGGERYQAAQWPAHRSISRWDGRSSDFNMSPAQLSSYRQLGPYGAYRVLFRTLGLTAGGDGWTPGRPALALSQYVDGILEREASAPSWVNRPQSSDQARWWLRTGWKKWLGAGSTTSLLLSSRIPAPLSTAEIAVIRPILFPHGSARLRTALALGTSIQAADYVALCRLLAKKLPSAGADPRVAWIGLLANLNQTGIDLLRVLATALDAGIDTVPRLVLYPPATRSISKFKAAAKAWISRPVLEQQFEHAEEANILAAVGTASGEALLKRFMGHHESRGSGVRWIAVQDDRILPLGAESGIDSGSFGYRLHALGSLALQCRIISAMPAALSSAAANTIQEDE